jgi:hypothetical protein
VRQRTLVVGFAGRPTTSEGKLYRRSIDNGQHPQRPPDHAINALHTPARVQTAVRDDSAQGAMTQPRLQQLQQTLMRRLQTLVNCIDNSGAAIVECVNVLRSKRPAKVGKSGQFARGCWG